MCRRMYPPDNKNVVYICKTSLKPSVNTYCIQYHVSSLSHTQKNLPAKVKSICLNNIAQA